MIRRLSGQLPTWARPDHPVLRYELGKVRPLSRRARWLRALAVVLVGLLLVAGGYLVATGFLTHPAGISPTESISAVVFWPLLALQLITRLSALALNASAVGDEVRRQNWDSVRATPVGAELALRARWAATFYRLRLPLGLILLVRVVLILGVLYDLTGFQGRYLDLLINGIIPDVPLVAAVLLLSLLLTSALLLPITGVGIDAALGVLLSTLVRQRVYSALVQALVILVRVAVAAALAYAVARLLGGALQVDDWKAWLLFLGFAALGDWGLAMLNLGLYGEIWARVPYGILLGLALLVFALFQALIADQLLGLAVRRAERRG